MRQTSVFLDRSWTESLPIYTWVVEHPEGVIVVDTGDTARTAVPGYLPRWHPYYRFAVRARRRAATGDRAAAGTARHRLRKRAGGDPDLPAHGPRAGGPHNFSNSAVLVAQAEHEATQGFGGRLRGYLPNRWPGWFRGEPITFDPNPFGPFERSRALTADGSVIAVPAPGHVSFVVEDDASYFLVGGISYTERLPLEEALDAVSPDDRAALQRLAVRLVHNLVGA